MSQGSEVKETVAAILNAVKESGDVALMAYTRKFDSPVLESLEVTREEIDRAVARVAPELMQAIAAAASNIRALHEAQMPKPLRVQTQEGVVCEKRFVAIERVGLYVPGGSAPLPSTLMMLAIPAKLAGCTQVCLTTPPDPNGNINDLILATADYLGIDRIFKCGGAQAIAALAYGTQSIPKADKVFGPGNAWVTEAKMQVAFDPRGAAIDLPAGPSEVMVLADASASARFVASDLLSQAEHDPASQVILVSTDRDLIDQVQKEVVTQLETLPRREIAQQALASSRAILAKDVNQALEIANLYAPEHLILQLENASEAANQVRHAGSVFIGEWTPESAGDYASGTNHVLPTYGFARAFSGLGLLDFMKSISFQEITRAGLMRLGPVVEKLANAEGLDAHARAISIRLQAIGMPSRQEEK